MFKKRQQININSWMSGNWWQWLVVLGVLIILIGGIGMWMGMRQERKWDGERRLTVAVVDTGSGNQVRLFSIQPEVNVVLVDLAGSVKMRVARGYGYYLVSSLYGLAKQENNLELMTETLTQELGIPVDGIIVMSNVKCQMSNVAKEVGIDCLKYVLKEWWWDRKIESNISKGDRFAIWWQARQMNQDLFKQIDFTQGQWARETEDVDGLPLIEFDKNAIDAYLPEWLTDRLVRSENLQARVINTVPVAGLGSQIARITNGLGVKVVEVRNTTGGLGQCVIQTREELRESLSVRRLLEVFDCKLDERELEDRRADMEIRGGFEQAREWVGK